MYRKLSLYKRLKAWTIVIFLLLLNSTILFAQSSKSDFKVFNAILFKKLPDLSKYGFSKINMVYEDGVISTNYHVSKKSTNRRFIDLNKVIKQSKISLNFSNLRIPTCLDVECWNLYSSEKNRSIERYVNLIKLYRSRDPNSLVSVFAHSTYSDKIAKVSNVFFPSFYTQNQDRKLWLAGVTYAIRKLKKVNPNTPIYGFVWPQFNPNSKYPNLKRTFLDTDLWRYELETLYKYCDGIVIWTGRTAKDGSIIYFDKNMPWFQETLKFMKAHNIN